VPAPDEEEVVEVDVYVPRAGEVVVCASGWSSSKGSESRVNVGLARALP
jgi:hypothetical protein